MRFPVLRFEQSSGERCPFIWCDSKDPYLENLKSTYRLDQIAGKASDHVERIRNVCNWVHQLWEHDGATESEKKDPNYIIEQAMNGKRFRCVEYAIVLHGCLSSLGYISRVVNLMTEDCETRPSSAGHVVVEVFLRDRGQWAMIDPQWNVFATSRSGRCLSCVELQEWIASRREDLDCDAQYMEWIYPYLHYFATNFDQRFSEKYASEMKGAKQLMLVPVGSKKPGVFQIRYPLKDVIYTHSLSDFYSIS